MTDCTFGERSREGAEFISVGATAEAGLESRVWGGTHDRGFVRRANTVGDAVNVVEAPREGDGSADLSEPSKDGGPGSDRAKESSICYCEVGDAGSELAQCRARGVTRTWAIPSIIDGHQQTNPSGVCQRHVLFVDWSRQAFAIEREPEGAEVGSCCEGPMRDSWHELTKSIGDLGLGRMRGRPHREQALDLAAGQVSAP